MKKNKIPGRPQDIRAGCHFVPARPCSYLYLLIAFLVITSAITTDVSLEVLLRRGSRFFDILRAMVPPDFGFAGQVIKPLVATVRMSLVGTFMGAVLGLLAAVCANAYTDPWRGPRFLIKAFIHVFRSIPTLILALVCTFIFGLGTTAGTVAIAVSTTAILARQGYEDMENTDLTTAAVLEAAGCGRMRAFVRTGLPQIAAGYVTNVLYIWEANVRHAAILGYVGAGGIGLLLNERLAFREYRQTGMILVLLYILVIITEGTSEWLRLKLVNGIPLSGRVKALLWGSLPAVFLLCLGAVSLPETQGSGFRVVNAMAWGLVHPDWSMVFSLERDGLPYLLYETFCIAFLGTVGGALLAAFFSFTGSFRLLPSWAALGPRALLLVLRTIPVVIYGLLWIRVTGPGPFAGVLTLALCSVGLLAKRFLIAIDGIDLGPWEAQKAAGISVPANLRWTVLPQLGSRYVTAILYRFDINIREAAVLGLVGAGGVGTPLILALMHYAWSEAGALLWGMLLLSALASALSEWNRKKQR